MPARTLHLVMNGFNCHASEVQSGSSSFRPRDSASVARTVTAAIAGRIAGVSEAPVINPSASCKANRAPKGIRTLDPRIKSPMLYQLSYGRACQQRISLDERTRIQYSIAVIICQGKIIWKQLIPKHSTPPAQTDTK